MRNLVAGLSGLLRSRRLRLWLFGFGLLVVVSGVGGWLYVNHAMGALPEWWSPMDGNDEAVRALGADTENEVVSTVNRVRGRGDGARWTITLSEEGMNAWLAARLPRWSANQYPGSFLAVKVRYGQVHIEDGGWLRVGVMVFMKGSAEAGSDEGGQSFSCLMRPFIDENGLLFVELKGAAVGRLPLPTGSAVDYILKNSGVTDSTVREVLMGGGVRVMIQQGKKRRIVLESVEVDDDEKVVTLGWRTEVVSGSGG